LSPPADATPRNDLSPMGDAAMPDFSYQETMAIWTALQQFVDNCQESVDLHLCDPGQHPMPEGYDAAVAALDKVEAVVQEMLDEAPAPR